MIVISIISIPTNVLWEKICTVDMEFDFFRQFAKQKLGGFFFLALKTFSADSEHVEAASRRCNPLIHATKLRFNSADRQSGFVRIKMLTTPAEEVLFGIAVAPKTLHLRMKNDVRSLFFPAVSFASLFAASSPPCLTVQQARKKSIFHPLAFSVVDCLTIYFLCHSFSFRTPSAEDSWRISHCFITEEDMQANERSTALGYE